MGSGVDSGTRFRVGVGICGEEGGGRLGEEGGGRDRFLLT